MAYAAPTARVGAKKRGGAFYALIGGAALVLVLIVAGLVYMMSPDEKAPALSVANQFLDAIDNQDYKSAYELFDANNRSNLTADEFAKRATELMGRNGLAKSRRLVKSDVQPGTNYGTIVTLDYEIQYESRMLTVICRVHDTGEGWRILQAGPETKAASTRP